MNNDKHEEFFYMGAYIDLPPHIRRYHWLSDLTNRGSDNELICSHIEKQVGVDEELFELVEKEPDGDSHKQMEIKFKKKPDDGQFHYDNGPKL